MKHWLQFLAVLVMVVVAGISPRAATAAPSVGTPGVANTTRIINDIINRTPGITTRITTGTGVTVKATGSSAAVARGISIPIAEVAEAAVSGGRIAGIAAKAIRWGSWVGVASVVIPWVAEQSGIVTCPPPDFFCKPRPPEEVDPSTGGYAAYSIHAKVNVYASSGEKVCSKLFELMPIGARESIFWKKNVNNAAGECLYTSRPFGSPYAVVGTNAATCPSGTKLTSNGLGCIEEKSGLAPVQEPELAGAIEKAMEGKPDRQGAAYDAISNAGFPIFNTADPVVVTVPSVVTAPDQVTTSTKTENGQVFIITEKVSTELRPKVTGTTIGDTKIDYPAVTTITTTNKNTTTNEVTTNTTVINSPATPATVPVTPPAIKPVELPDSPLVTEKITIPNDYNKEVTQKSILDVLKDFVKPITAQLPNGDAETKSIKDQNDLAIKGVTDVTASSTGIANWFPSVPTAACIDPKVPTPITGAMVDVPICATVDLFSALVSGVLCFFCIVGCVTQVQAAMKA